MNNLNKKWYKPTNLGTKIFLTAIILLFIRMLANIPVPYINKEYLSILFEDKTAYSLINSFSGGAFTKMSFMALGITPYITGSIILQLLSITFPRLKEIQRDGNYGKKRWKLITILTGIGLGVVQAVGMAITFGKSGLFTAYNFSTVSIVCLLWIIGGAIVILLGEYISKFCIGNGISLILATNIIAELPGDIVNFWNVYIANKAVIEIVGSVIVLVAIMFLLIGFTVFLTTACKEIKVIYPTSRANTYKNSSFIPIKLNAAGVMPIIFTSTLFSFPLMFISTTNTNKVAQAIYQLCNSMYRYNFKSIYTYIAIVLSGVLVVLFAYFYTAITINTTEIANKLRKKGACIPGIRPGKPTDDYLYDKIKYMTFIGAVMLFILTQIPVLITSFSNISSLSIGGTSVIIVVGVIMETALAIKTEMLNKSYSKNTNKLLFGMSRKSTSNFLS